ncbi:MAG: protein phosphatase 2C domain-containing protein [Acidobacteria bacterium]|nr:protein phosphatase 2C domain-containing protein [Acidobacteriota bacterium]MBI3422180.1 protein phosphatase 2C domain-containing protein [Acidobacteriota bacterium]
MNVALYAQTDVGMVRSGNEDNFLILDLSTGTSWSAGEEEPPELLTFQQGYYGSLLAVSDGMGGALAGEVASRLAVETVRDRMLQLQAHQNYGKVPFQERLRLAIEEANLLIHSDGMANPAHKGLGATFTGVAVHSGHAYFAQVGDSRAYLIRKGKIARITKDQSLVQQLIDAGQITEEEAETHSYRNVILQALGAHINVNVEVNTLPVCHLDTLVLCSDGLSGKMHAEEILQIVQESADFKTACQNLITLANQRGGEDNITVVIAQFSGSALEQPEGDAIEPQGIARSPDTPTELNWSAGATTDQLTDPTGPDLAGEAVAGSPARTGALTGELNAKKTGPLVAPIPPPPTTSPLPSRTTPLKSTNDMTDRVGPITAVFEIGDFEEELKTTSADGTGDLLPHAPQTNHSGRMAATASHGQGEQKSFSFLPVILTIIALAGIGGAAFWYFNQQQRSTAEAEAVKQHKRLERETQKQSLLTSLHDEITKLKNDLAAAPKVGTEKREKLGQKLNRAQATLIDIAQLSPERIDEIEQRCEDVAKELKQIKKDLEEDLKTQQGTLPAQSTSREPVKL